MGQNLWLIEKWIDDDFMNLACAGQIYHCLYPGEVVFEMDNLARNDQASKFSPSP